LPQGDIGAALDRRATPGESSRGHQFYNDFKGDNDIFSDGTTAASLCGECEAAGRCPDRVLRGRRVMNGELMIGLVMTLLRGLASRLGTFIQ
jgi:hypothetical protein